MIQAQNVVKSFGPTLAVDDVSFTVEKGEVLGFLGPNGAGKSTTMRLITGFLPLNAGKVTVGGHDIEDQPIEAKRLIGYLPENAPAYPEMTVDAFLSFVAALRGLRGAAKAKAIDRVVDTCFLHGVRFQAIDTLSKGYRHRTGFPQSIIHDPPILVLDEPTDGLDPNQKHEVRQLISRMGKEKAIIVSTHILEEVDATCSRVIIIDRGKLVFNGSPEDLRGRSTEAGAVRLRVLGQEAKDVKDALQGIREVSRVEVLEATEAGVAAEAFPRDRDGRRPAVALPIQKLMVEKGWEFDELHTEKGRMDEVFRSITIPDTAEEDSK